jgi:hypothetical protein
VLVLSKGSVGPAQLPPSAYVAERCRARAVAVLAVSGERPEPGAAATVASVDRAFQRQMADVLGDIGMAVTVVPDVTEVERRLAGDVLSARAA